MVNRRQVGMVIGIRRDRIAEYKVLHQTAWEGVLAGLARVGIHNYSIFLREPENLLFSYFEYDGNDLDMAFRELGNDPETRRWWALTDPCQQPLESSRPGEWWAPMEQVFYFSGHAHDRVGEC